METEQVVLNLTRLCVRACFAGPLFAAAGKCPLPDRQSVVSMSALSAGGCALGAARRWLMAAPLAARVPELQEATGIYNIDSAGV